jgi:GntR family transcriptional repressor for pyruvate dehydrogenase complex
MAMDDEQPQRDDRSGLVRDLRELSGLIDGLVAHIDLAHISEGEVRAMRSRTQQLGELLRPAVAPVPAAAERAPARVMDTLTEMIRRRELVPGDRLPPERDLAEQLGVGRNSVREAIRQLALVGLIEARQGGGTYVLDPSAAALARPFRNVVELSTARPREILEFRVVFEPLVAGLAAQRARHDPAGLRALAESLELFEEAVGTDPERALRYDGWFHARLAECTGNLIVLAVQHALVELLEGFRRRDLVDGSYDPSVGAVRGHRTIYEAVAAGDVAAAAAAMTQHLEHVARLIGEDGAPSQ